MGVKTNIMVVAFLVLSLAVRAGTVVPHDRDTVLRLTAATLYLEAGSESNHGKLGVASVIWNRSCGAKNLSKVILARKQFSCWNHRKLASFKPPKNASYAYCLAVAKDMVDGNFVPSKAYQGAIAYHEQSVKPKWRFHYQLAAQVGNHLFYQEMGWRV